MIVYSMLYTKYALFSNTSAVLYINHTYCIWYTVYILYIVFNGCGKDRSGCSCIHHVSGGPVHLYQQVRIYVIDTMYANDVCSVFVSLPVHTTKCILIFSVNVYAHLLAYTLFNIPKCSCIAKYWMPISTSLLHIYNT